MDFHNARLVGCRKWKKIPKLGMGPIETLRNLGGDQGLKEIQATTKAHFDKSYPFNPFSWLTNIIEVVLIKQIPAINQLTTWLKWMKSQWPDTE